MLLSNNYACKMLEKEQEDFGKNNIDVIIK